MGIAVRLGWEQSLGAEAAAAADYNEHSGQAWKDFYASPPHRIANMVMNAFAYLVEQSRQVARAAREAALIDVQQLTEPAVLTDDSPSIDMSSLPVIGAHGQRIG